MTYRLQVTRLEKNPAYDEELAKVREREKYGYGGQPLGYPIEHQEVGVLTVELSEEQWQAVKQAVLETWR